MLSIEPVKDFSSANPYVELKWKGFSLNEIASNPELRFFKVKTFTALFSATGLGMTYNPANEFLSTLSLEEQKTIAQALIVMYIEILSDYGVERIAELEDTLGDILNKLDDSIDLCGRIKYFVEHSNIPISDMEFAGTRPQHTPDMTFHKEEAVDFVTISILMKVISPVTGAFIDKYNKIIDTRFKELHAYAIMRDIFQKRYAPLIIKFRNYIRTLISSKHKDDSTSTINGNTLEATTDMAEAVLVIKRITGMDLYRPDGNVITYIASCCRFGVDSQQQNASVTKPVKIIAAPVDLDKDEGNASVLESESKQSASTADTATLIRWAATKTTQRIIKEEGIDAELMESVIAFYNRNMVAVNPITEYLLCSYYGADIGGAQGIRYLGVKNITEFIALLQIILARNNTNLLAHALSFTVGTVDKPMTFESSTFMTAWKSTQVYTGCKRVFPSGFGDRDWDTKLKEISTFLSRKTCIYNTAPAIWTLMDAEPLNGKTFEDLKDLMVEIMLFIQLYYKSKQFN